MLQCFTIESRARLNQIYIRAALPFQFSQFMWLFFFSRSFNQPKQILSLILFLSQHFLINRARNQTRILQIIKEKKYFNHQKDEIN